MSSKWNSASDHVMVTHQDGMAKLYLPFFCATASFKTTRVRFDVTGNGNTVTNEYIVLSHELGAPSKNIADIFESILIDRLLLCRGESIKLIRG